VNPRACHETELVYTPTEQKKKIAVVGSGPAGLSFSTVAASRGHDVTVFDDQEQVGGQFNVAKRIPGKEEFYETLRYFKVMIEKTGVKLNLGKRVSVDDLLAGDFDEVVLATGISPRTPAIDGIDHPKVVSYLDTILERKHIGKKVAIIGAGGIGFDTAEFLTHGSESPSLDIDLFMKEWGVDLTVGHRGGVIAADVSPSEREVYLIQRKASKVGQNLGKTSGWVHRTGLKKKGVHMINSAEYQKVDDQGLHLLVNGEPQVLEVDNIILCAGQEPLRELQEGLESAGKIVHLIGGADVAAELDAKRAINQGSRLAAEI